MITEALARTIAREKVPEHLREDAAQEALIASWQAEQRGQPEVLAARRRVIDFYRRWTHVRKQNTWQDHIRFVPLLDDGHRIADQSVRPIPDPWVLRKVRQHYPKALAFYEGDHTQRQGQIQYTRLKYVRKGLGLPPLRSRKVTHEKTDSRAIAA